MCRARSTEQDRARGYRYQLALRQIELSDTRVFDRPQAGRDWFERLLRDQLSLGRPDQVAVVFARTLIATTTGRFCTRVLNRGDQAALQVHSKHSKVKQYLKESRALRTETTVNDTREFGIGRLLNQQNWQALLQLGHQVNERLLDAQLQACACAPDATTLARVVLPSRTRDGLPAPPLRFGDPRVQALLAALCALPHPLEGLSNKSLRPLLAGLLPGYTPRQITYHLRRLPRNGFLTPTAGSQRRQPTAEGRTLAVFFPKPTAASSPPHWPNSTPPCQPRSPHTAHSPAPGEPTNTPSTTRSTTPPSQPEKMTQP